MLFLLNAVFLNGKIILTCLTVMNVMRLVKGFKSNIFGGLFLWAFITNKTSK